MTNDAGKKAEIGSMIHTPPRPMPGINHQWQGIHSSHSSNSNEKKSSN
jgi:hypothetical protein